MVFRVSRSSRPLGKGSVFCFLEGGGCGLKAVEFGTTR